MHNDIIRSVDVLARLNDRIVLIERLTFPAGLALPGGKIEVGEDPVDTIRREFKEETGLVLEHAEEVCRVEGPTRDPRFLMSESIVFLGTASGTISDERGKTRVLLFDEHDLRAVPKERFAFDHGAIIAMLL